MKFSIGIQFTQDVKDKFKEDIKQLLEENEKKI